MQVLEQLLDRRHLEEHKPPPYAAVGVGYELVHHAEGSGKSSSRCSAYIKECDKQMEPVRLRRSVLKIAKSMVLTGNNMFGAAGLLSGVE